MVDFGAYMNYHVRGTSYNHTEDINRLNILLARYGLKVNRYADSPFTVTYVVNLAQQKIQIDLIE